MQYAHELQQRTGKQQNRGFAAAVDPFKQIAVYACPYVLGFQIAVTLLIYGRYHPSKGSQGHHISSYVPGQAGCPFATLLAVEHCMARIVLKSYESNILQALRHNPATWRVPYDHVVYKDPKQVHVSYCLQFLLVLLLYSVPEGTRGPPPKNYFRHFLGRLHRSQDFQFIVDGMRRTLNQPVNLI